MNKEELRKKYIEEFSGPGYSYVKPEDKELELKFHDLFVDVMLNEESAKRLCSMCPVIMNNVPAGKLDPNDLDSLLYIEKCMVHHDILDDGEFIVIYDPVSGKWFFDTTYEFLDNAEFIVKKMNLDLGKVEMAFVNSWRRRVFKGMNGKEIAFLGIEDLITILEHVKTGDFTGLRDQIPLTNLKERLEEYNRS